MVNPEFKYKTVNNVHVDNISDLSTDVDFSEVIQSLKDIENSNKQDDIINNQNNIINILEDIATSNMQIVELLTPEPEPEPPEGDG